VGSITDPNQIPRRDYPPRRSVPSGLLDSVPFGAGAPVYTRGYSPRNAADVTLFVNADQDGVAVLQRKDDQGIWRDQDPPCAVLGGVESPMVIFHPAFWWRVAFLNTNATPGTVRVEVAERNL